MQPVEGGYEEVKGAAGEECMAYDGLNDAAGGWRL